MINIHNKIIQKILVGHTCTAVEKKRKKINKNRNFKSFRVFMFSFVYICMFVCATPAIPLVYATVFLFLSFFLSLRISLIPRVTKIFAPISVTLPLSLALSSLLSMSFVRCFARYEKKTTKKNLPPRLDYRDKLLMRQIHR